MSGIVTITTAAALSLSEIFVTFYFNHSLCLMKILTFGLQKYIFIFIKPENQMQADITQQMQIHHSNELNNATRFRGQYKQRGRSQDLCKCCFQWSRASCLVLFTCFQWIMYLQWFMVRHAQPFPSRSTWDPAWIFHWEPTGKTKIAQFKEVIKTVRNQYLSLAGPRWGFSVSPSPHFAQCLVLCPPARIIDICSAPSNKKETGASCSDSGLWHVLWIIKWP